MSPGSDVKTASLRNPMRKLLDTKPYGLGTFITLTDSTAVELAALAGFDYVVVECEHGGASLETLRDHLRAARARDIGAMVRVPAGDWGFIQRVLDIGADGVLVPHISDVSAVTRSVSAVRYPPTGHRGMYPNSAQADFGAHSIESVRDVIDTLNRSTVLAIMIEDASAIADIDAIIAVSGVDIVVVGPSDLSASLGVVGRSDNQELARAIERVFDVCRAAGVKFGIPTEHAAFYRSANELREQGAWLLASGSDATLLLGGWRSLVKRLRDA